MSTAADLIRRFEGCRLTAYQDRGGVWTVGYGCTGQGISEGTEWTQQHAEDAVEHIATAVESVVRSLVKVPLTDLQAAALTSFAYNEGTHALGESTLLRLLNAGLYVAAGAQFLLWDKVHVNGELVPDAGLLNRRHAERTLFMRDVT